MNNKKKSLLTTDYKLKTSSGFTLIELLVVIAIIGILAAVVLASLGSTRSKGKDAAIKEEMNSLRNEMENSANDIGYTSCSTGQSAIILDSITKKVPAKTSGKDVRCNSTTSAWAATAELNLGGYWCVDSNGYGGPVASSLGTNTIACPSGSTSTPTP